MQVRTKETMSGTLYYDASVKRCLNWDQPEIERAEANRVVPVGLTVRMWEAEKIIQLPSGPLGARLRVPFNVEFRAGNFDELDFRSYHRPAKGEVPELALVYAYSLRIKTLFFRHEMGYTPPVYDKDYEEFMEALDADE